MLIYHRGNIISDPAKIYAKRNDLNTHSVMNLSRSDLASGRTSMQPPQIRISTDSMDFNLFIAFMFDPFLTPRKVSKAYNEFWLHGCLTNARNIYF